MHYRAIFCTCFLLCLPSLSAQPVQRQQLSGNDLLTASFADSLHGWVGGVNTLMRTTDGGATWVSNILAANGGSFTSVKAVGPAHAWVVWRNGAYSYVARTLNAGGSWDTVRSMYFNTICKFTFTHIDALDSVRCWVVGSVDWLCAGPPYAEKTTDGGASWSWLGGT